MGNGENKGIPGFINISFVVLFVFLLFLVATSCGEEDDIALRPVGLLIGTWDLIGFSDGGVDGETTGTAVFGVEGSFCIEGTVTFPGEPTDAISLRGRFEQGESSVTFAFLVLFEMTMYFTGCSK